MIIALEVSSNRVVPVFLPDVEEMLVEAFPECTLGLAHILDATGEALKAIDNIMAIACCIVFAQESFVENKRANGTRSVYLWTIDTFGRVITCMAPFT